jgi:hypothetical protein
MKPNNEDIFIRQYSLSDPQRNSDNSGPHSYDATMTCRYMTADGLSRTYPSLDYVERFGTLPIVNTDGTPTRFNDRGELMTMLEPRLQATIYFPGATLRGLTFDVQRGIYKTFNGSAAQELSNNLNTANDVNTNYPDTNGTANLIFASDYNSIYRGHRVLGLAGWNPSKGDDNTRTGLYLRKYIDYAKPQSACGLYQSAQSYIDMRYAEVLLNRAEAGFELGGATQADALSVINQLRDRAGAIPATASMTIDTILN